MKGFVVVVVVKMLDTKTLLPVTDKRLWFDKDDDEISWKLLNNSLKRIILIAFFIIYYSGILWRSISLSFFKLCVILNEKEEERKDHCKDMI